MKILTPTQFFSERASGKFIAPRAEGLFIPERQGPKKNPFAHTRGGWRPTLGLVVRSSWENNVCLVLKGLGIDFNFEPRIFEFPIKRGTGRFYTPDIYLPKTHEWIEVKGWWDAPSRLKIKRFRKYYPHEFEKLIVIIQKGSVKSLEMCEELHIPRGMFYQDIGKLYADKLAGLWE